MNADDSLPDDIATLKAALIAERSRRIDAETRAAHATANVASAEVLIAHLKLAIEKMRRELYGSRSERGARLLDQMELELEDLEASATEDEIAAAKTTATTPVPAHTRRKPSRKAFPEHLPRERVIVPAPTSCTCCGSTRLARLGEDITETLEVIPRQWKVIQHVREKFTCRDCEKISQAPAPFHVVARGWAGPSLLAMILFEKYGQHQPLNRQSERYTREGVDLSLSTLADQVGACAAVLTPLHDLIRAHVLAGQRIHGDDTPVPVLAKGQTVTGRAWVYVRDDRPFAGTDPPAALFFYSRDRAGEHPERHLDGFNGILQADAFAGFNRLYDQGRKPGPVSEAACWAHARRKFFVLADLASRSRKRTPAAISPLALEAVRRIDAGCQRQAITATPRCQGRAHGAAGRQSRGLDAKRAQGLVPPCRCRQGNGLHAEALGCLYPLPAGWPHLPVEQRSRTRPARHCHWQKIVALRRLRPRRRTRRRHVHADRHRKAQ
jgi:transposase